MIQSHFPVCINPATALPTDVLFAYVNAQTGAVVSNVACGTVGVTYRVFLRPDAALSSTDQFADGAILGAGILGIMAIAWTIKYLSRAL